MSEKKFAPGMRVLIRGEEWLVKRVDTNTLGNQALRCYGISPLVKDREAVFLEDLDAITPVDPTKTKLVADDSPRRRNTRLFLESQLRRKAPSDAALHIGQKAAMDPMPFQFEPAWEALKRPRQRILIADTVGLGKTLEAGILMSELIARGKGKRILVVTAKSMLTQFQMEMWNRFTIPLVRLDSAKIQRIRAELPSNANPFFYYDKAIVSIDTIKRGVEYGVHLENAYWDIIVIDEAQNVAERGTRRAARSKLASKLASRSDTLIMLSATPHDGRPRSFASLMNMLDPTAIADPEHYLPEDIKGLCVRRFKKDVRSQVAGTFLEREVGMMPCKASPQEEEAFDIFSEMNLKMDESRRTGSQLFKIGLEKALFSSPAACIETIDNRLKRLAESDPFDKTGDAAKLEELRSALERIDSSCFSRYQGLLTLLKDEGYSWNPNKPDDRIVIFTERIATMRYVAENLRCDLGMDESAIRTMDGGMSDIDQQEIVAEFGREASPLRILVASDVASEGINLHYFSHRLVHFDTPWSLMVFQQRNGRIDRYGQQQRPDIRFLTIAAENRRIRGDARIIEILIEKEQQAHDNIGDPAMLLNKFDVDEETRVVEEAIAGGSDASEFESKFSMPGGAGAAILDLFISQSQDSAKGQVPTAEDKTLLSDMAYLKEGLAAFGDEGGITSFQDLEEARGIRLRLEQGSELYRRFRKTMPEWNPDNGVLVLSDDPRYCMEEAKRARKAEFELGNWPQAQYLWKLHPIFEWIADKSSMQLFKRDEAPAIACDELKAGEAIFLVQGVIPNRKSAPVVDEWVGVRFIDGVFDSTLSLDEVVRITSVDDQGIPNSRVVSQSKLDVLMGLCPEAIKRAGDVFSRSYREYKSRIDPQIDEEIDKLGRLEEKHKEVQLSLFPDERRRDRKRREIEELFGEYVEWVTDTLEIENNPSMRIQTVFVGVAR